MFKIWNINILGAHIEKNGSREIWIFILGDGSIGQIGDFGRWEHPVKKKWEQGDLAKKNGRLGDSDPPIGGLLSMRMRLLHIS